MIQSRTRRIAIILAAGLFAVSAFFVDSHIHGARVRIQNEVLAYNKLGQATTQAIRAIQTSSTQPRSCITFKELEKYITLNHPEWCTYQDPSNPFPGLLPPGKYRVYSDSICRETDVILMSETAHHRPNGGSWQFKLLANGQVER